MKKNNAEAEENYNKDLATYKEAAEKKGATEAEKQRYQNFLEQYPTWESYKTTLEDQYKEALDEIGKLREQLALLEQLKKENEQLREYLDLRGDRPEWILTDAEVIYNNDPTGKTVTLNKGSRHGIARTGACSPLDGPSICSGYAF